MSGDADDDPAAFGAFVRRAVRAYGRRVGHTGPAGLPGLLGVHGVVDEAAQEAVTALRALGLPWSAIGAGAGVSRQDAYKRWGASTRG